MQEQLKGAVGEYVSCSADDTFSLGYNLGRQAEQGEIYALFADMGMGKTVFAKGFAAGLGISRNVNSPTFTLVREYHGGRLPFYHFDVYRIDDIDEMQELGYCDYFYSNGVCLIEWASLIEELLPEYTVNIRIEPVTDEPDKRRIFIGKEDSSENTGI